MPPTQHYVNDKYVMTKHASIYPAQNELEAVQNVVNACEKALKKVSDIWAGVTPKGSAIKEEDTVKPENDGDIQMSEDDQAAITEKKKPAKVVRILKGVMRVGVLADGLLLKGDLNVQLVVLCSSVPTVTMLMKLGNEFPKQLDAITDGEKLYSVMTSIDEAALIVTTESEPKATCTITLTSPVLREITEKEDMEDDETDPRDVLNEDKCLDGLAALRHAKWFQVEASTLEYCVVVIRVLRDLCRRTPTWGVLGDWALELIVERCLESYYCQGPSDAFRRVMECFAAGMVMDDGPGLLDPCEKETTDALEHLTPQQREDITSAAQYYLRLIAFREIHQVLGMEILPKPDYSTKWSAHKRKSTSTGGQNGAVGEKKAKDGEETVTSPTPVATS